MSKTSRQHKQIRQSLFSVASTCRLIPDVSPDTTKETVNKRIQSLAHYPAGESGLPREALSTLLPLPQLPEEWQVPAEQTPSDEVRAVIRRNLEQVKHPAKRWFPASKR